MARCPNCGRSLDIRASTCSECTATFAAGAAWRPIAEGAEEAAALRELYPVSGAANVSARVRVAAFGWLVTLVCVHFACEVWIHVGFLGRTWSYDLGAILWGLTGFSLPMLFALGKNPAPLIIGGVLLTLYEALRTYAAIANPQRYVASGWWLIEPIAVSVVFLCIAVPMLFVSRKRESVAP